MKSLFSRLPEIWKDLDLRATPVVNGKGLLERYLNVGDAGFQQIENFIQEFLRTHNSEAIQDQFLPLLIDLTGEYWKATRSRTWNRNRIQSSITRASYKGTDLCVTDLTREYGASYCQIIDMASMVAVEARQGTYTGWDDVFYDSDFYHPGVFQLVVSEDIDLIGFLDDFQHVKPAGTRWLPRILLDQGIPPIRATLLYSLPSISLEAGTNFGYENFGIFDYIPQLGVEPLSGPPVFIYVTPTITLEAGTNFGYENYNVFDFLPQFGMDPQVGDEITVTVSPSTVYPSLMETGTNFGYENRDVFDITPQLGAEPQVIQ